MDPERMLRILSECGEDAASDYNDALDGWFGWQVTGDLMTVTWTPGTDTGDADKDGTQVRSWRLTSA